MLRFVAPLVVFGLMVVVFWLGLGRDPSVVPSPLIGKPAPAFSLPRLDNPDQTLSDSDLRGQVSLVNVWGTWCVGCRQEHDTLLAIAESGEVPIYGLNWKDDSLQARAWLQRLGDPYAATGVDADGRVAIDWGVYGAPETFLIAADGTVVYKHIAPLNLDIWQREFVPRIRELKAGG
jgi:cytochrome c biogenesis protein CcmG/thiol:disulfide interchange protein DsbE